MNPGRREKLFFGALKPPRAPMRGTHGDRSPTESRGRAPGQGAKLPEAERFLALECPK